MKSILEIKSLSKKIGKKQVLKDITFDVNEGEIFGFVGPNGAGKTTLIKTMLGLYSKDEGTVLIGGYNLDKDFEKAMQQIGAIIENPEMYDYLSGRDNLYIYMKMGCCKDNNYIKEIVRTVKLENRINNKVKTYSLGMRQRLGLAQALISKPKLLILDEPTNGLDPIGIKELRELLKRIAKENNIAVFISSHILSEIELMCDKIAIIDEGHILEVKDLKSNNRELDIKVLIDTNNLKKASSLLIDNGYNNKLKDNYICLDIKKMQIPVVNKLLVDKGFKVFEIKQVKKTLEDEFIEKTKGTKGQIK